MTTRTRHPSRGRLPCSGGAAAPNGNGMMPLVGLMVRPFPEPGPTIRTAMEQLQQATVEPPAERTSCASSRRCRDPGTRPRAPADAAELWAWLDLVAIWVNEQHLWNVTRRHPRVLARAPAPGARPRRAGLQPLLHQLRRHPRRVGGLAPLRAADVPRAAA